MCSKKIKEELENQINEVNEFKTGLLESSNNLDSALIKEKLNKCKSNLMHTKSINSKNFNYLISNNLFKYKFTQSLDLYKQNKYVDLILNPKEIQMNFKDNGQYTFFLPFKKVLLYDQNEEGVDISIYDENGSLLKTKCFYFLNKFNSNIWVFDSAIFLRIRNYEGFKIEVYDLNLDLVHSFSINTKFYFHGFFNNYFCLKSQDNVSYLIVNMNSFELKYLHFQNKDSKQPFYIYQGTNETEKKVKRNDVCTIYSRLCHFNDQKLYFSKYIFYQFRNDDNDKDDFSIFILDRKNGSFFNKILINTNDFEIKFDKYSNIYYQEECKREVTVYNSNGQLMHVIRLNTIIKNYLFTYFDDIVFNLNPYYNNNSSCYMTLTKDYFRNYYPTYNSNRLENNFVLKFLKF